MIFTWHFSLQISLFSLKFALPIRLRLSPEMLPLFLKLAFPIRRLFTPRIVAIFFQVCFHQETAAIIFEEAFFIFCMIDLSRHYSQAIVFTCNFKY